jgi:murein L,D-transpeptidase YafK
MLRSPLFALLLMPALAVADIASETGYVLQVPASVRTVLVAETDLPMLHIFSVDEHGRVSRLQQSISIGQRGAGKRKSGDRRTPLGVYFVVEELDTRNLHEKYGPVAYPLDYPNVWDTVNRRTGHGIWIHGMAPGNGPRPVRDTDGCISLPNDALLNIGPDLAPLQTPVIVTRRLQRTKQTELQATRDQLLAALDDWSRSYRSGDWYSHLAMYAGEFTYRGMSRDEWTAYRLSTVGQRVIDDFAIGDITLIADPVEPGLYVSRFRQEITESGRTVAATKRLYWQRSAQGNFKIIAEDNG